MGSAMYLDTNASMAGALSFPTQRGPFALGGMESISRQTLPTDPIGTTSTTFAGVNADCEIRVFLPNGTEVAGVESCVANQVLTWSVYAPGSANNNVTIRIVGNAYKIKEFPYVSQLGNVTLPVQQELDKWYSNPV